MRSRCRADSSGIFKGPSVAEYVSPTTTQLNLSAFIASFVTARLAHQFTENFEIGVSSSMTGYEIR